MCIGRVGFEVSFELILLQFHIYQRREGESERAEQVEHDRLMATGLSGILILI